MRFFRNEKGFTLIELMVVILIIGILVAIAVPVFNQARAGAQKRTCQANLRTIDGAIQTWRADYPDIGANPWPTDSSTAATALVPNYLKAWPKCPSGPLPYAFAAGAGSAAPTVSCPNDPTHTYP